MTPRISVYVKNGVNPNYRAFLLGAARIGERAGATVTQHFPAIPDNVEQQIALLQQDLGHAPDAILFNPADDVALKDGVAQISAKNIPAINFINRIDGDFVSFIGGDEFHIGVSAARYFFNAIGGQGNIAIIEGPATAPTARERLRGFHRVLREFPSLTLAGSACGHYQKPGGFEAMLTLLNSDAKIDAVIAANDLMALGALDALAQAGKRIPVMGSNGTVEAAQAIRDGRLLASVDYDGFKMGCIAMEAMLRHLQGGAIPKEILMPATIVHSGNVAPWLVSVEQRQPPEWNAVVGHR